MGEGNRNDYLITKAVRSFIFASVLTAALQQFIQITHSIIVGQLVGPDAVSAIALSLPLMMVPTMLFMLFASGASVVASKAAGERNYDKVAAIFTVSMVSTLAFSLLFSLTAWLFGPQLASAVCTDERLLPLVTEYLPVACALSLFTVLFQALSAFTEVDGRPSTVSRAMIGSLVFIAVLDVVLIQVFGMGIKAAAWSTGFADLMVATYLFTAFRKNQSSYKLCHTPRFRPVLSENVKNGLPFVLTLLVLALCALVMNSMVLHSLGADAMFAFSVAASLINLVNLFGNGTANTFRAIGGMYYGQKDYQGLRLLFRVLLRVMIVTAIVCTVVGELLTPQIVSLYGADSPELISVTVPRLRIILTMLIAFMPMLYMPAVFQVLGHLKLVLFGALIFNFLQMGSMYLFIETGHPDLLWWSFPIAAWAGQALLSLLVWLTHRHMPGTAPLTLLPTGSGFRHSLFLSVAANSASFKQAIDTIHQFASSIGCDGSTVYGVDACAEELLKNIMDHAGIGADHYIDVSVTESENELMLTIKDDGRPFNPLIVPQQDRGLGLTIVNGFSHKADYQYMYGQNMTFVSEQLHPRN